MLSGVFRILGLRLFHLSLCQFATQDSLSRAKEWAKGNLPSISLLRQRQGVRIAEQTVVV